MIHNESPSETSLADYCAECVRRFDCERVETLTEPVAVTWCGGHSLRAEYVCICCGYVWTCNWAADLWFPAA